MLNQRFQGVIEVRADRRADRLGRGTRRLQAVHDAHTLRAERFDAVRRANDRPRDLGLIDEPLALDDIGKRSWTGSWSRGVIAIMLPAANVPLSSMRSMSPFHSGQRATSAHARQIASTATFVSMLCSVVHISPTPISTQIIYAETIWEGPARQDG